MQVYFGVITNVVDFQQEIISVLVSIILELLISDVQYRNLEIELILFKFMIIYKSQINLIYLELLI